MIKNKKFKENLKALREENKMSQKQLANELSISEKTISSYETGRSEPDVDMLIKIANYFKIDVDELLRG